MWLHRIARSLRSSWSHDLLIGVVAGAVVGLVSLFVTETREDDRVRRGERLENLRFVRSASVPEKASQRLFAELDLSGLPMAGLDMSGADLRGAQMSESIVDGADLAHADLSGAQATESRFVGASMRFVTATCIDFDDETRTTCADLSEALLIGADLTGADLSFADLRGADLSGADLSRVDLSGADLTEAALPELPTGGASVVYDCGDGDTTWPEGVTPPPSGRCPT